MSGRSHGAATCQHRAACRAHNRGIAVVAVATLVLIVIEFAWGISRG